MLIYAIILESEIHSIGSEIRKISTYQKDINVDLGTRRKQTNRETEEKMDRWVKSRNE